MNIKEMRLEKGLKAKKVAEELGISRIQLCNLEKGLYKFNEPKIEMLSKLYGTSISEIKKAIKEVRKND